MFCKVIMIKTKSIKQYIRQAGYPSQVAFARAFGVDTSRMNAIVNNRFKGLSLKTIDRLCRTLNCQPGDILEYCPD